MCKANCLRCVIPVSVTTSAGIIDIPYTERLNNQRITHLWIRKPGGVQKDVNGKTLAAEGVIKTAHIRLMDADGTEKWKMPLESIQRDFNDAEPFCVDGLDIDSSQSTIILDTAATGYSPTAVIELLFAIACPAKNCQ